MDSDLCRYVVRITRAVRVSRVELIQELWSGYGSLSRVFLEGGAYTSVVVKEIRLPAEVVHPRGWGGAFGHRRKLESYRVEAAWYELYNERVSEATPTPRCLGSANVGEARVLVLEDL